MESHLLCFWNLLLITKSIRLSFMHITCWPYIDNHVCPFASKYLKQRCTSSTSVIANELYHVSDLLSSVLNVVCKITRESQGASLTFGLALCSVNGILMFEDVAKIVESLNHWHNRLGHHCLLVFYYSALMLSRWGRYRVSAHWLLLA